MVIPAENIQKVQQLQILLQKYHRVDDILEIMDISHEHVYNI